MGVKKRSPSRDVADRVLFREENGARSSRPASSDILVSDIPSGELEEDTFLAHLESQIYPDDADMPQRRPPINERPPSIDHENTEDEYPSKDDIPDSGVETAMKKSSKAKIVRRESS